MKETEISAALWARWLGKNYTILDILYIAQQATLIGLHGTQCIVAIVVVIIVIECGTYTLS